MKQAKCISIQSSLSGRVARHIRKQHIFCHILHGIIFFFVRVLSEPTRLCFVPLPSTRTLLPPSEPGVCNIPSNRLLRRGLSVVSPIFFDLQLLRRGINFVILSLRYHVVPHDIYHLRRMISAKMTDIAHNNTPHIIERPSRPCSLPSFQFRFWTSSPVHIPSVLYENEACASPPNISCFAEAHQRKGHANCHR